MKAILYLASGNTYCVQFNVFPMEITKSKCYSVASYQ